MSTHPNDPFHSGSPVHPNADPNAAVQPVNKSGWGCFLWGCLGTLTVAVVVMIASMFGVYYFVTGQVEKYTDTHPADVPVVDWDEARLDELQARIDAFSDQVKSGSPEDSSGADPDGEAATDGGGDAANEVEESAVPADLPRELRLTSEEINALISSNEELRGKAFVRIEDGRLYGQVTLPTDQIPGGKGRFFNADAEFEVSMNNGVLVVRLTSASVKGEPIPEAFMEGFSQQNLAKDAYDDVETAELLRKFDKIEVVDDAIVLQLREPESETTDSEDSNDEESPAETESPKTEAAAEETVAEEAAVTE
ncbi:putative signal peptide and transmembrane protein [Rhodopirellula islandica]|uniref:Signal peptide and transmembrane protein n=1 Tax=Rhodopirellula islandica TaxID=595434 RepID=A0A0J1BCU8_RHOIS|nr:hypothetical protein [Rhodopirellula islandica]KLU04412.1 putative signal peptide and transmembrane protein [Rhodopirellula islandica]